ncbi:MAG: glycosyltransferase [Pseudonocardiaceae bacterium]|nr:glycosyltransferase [Pseudonocardiaceae bacterium]
MLVCHDGARWLEEALAALRELTARPQYLIAVDTGSVDSTAELLAAADDVLDEVLTLPRDSGFGAAVAAAVERGEQRWGDPGRWVWLLHDDCAPEPGCLEALLSVAEASPSAALLGPLALDWEDPRLVVEAGLSTDAAGHRQTGIDAAELDSGQFRLNTEVLAVSSAGALIRRDVWTALGGYDPALPLLRDDLDFGWRVNRADHLVLCVPAARLRHAAALAGGYRELDAVPAGRRRAADRAHGLRTYLVNCSTAAFVVGLPRLVLLGLLRAIGLLLVLRTGAARAELAALSYLSRGRGGLRAARRRRRSTAPSRGVRSLLTSRLTRLRNAVRAGLAGLVRRRVQADAELGRLGSGRSTLGRLPEPGPQQAEMPPADEVGPDTLPADASPRRPAEIVTQRYAGLRRSRQAVAVPVAGKSEDSAASDDPADTAGSRPQPSPLPRDGSAVTGATQRAGRLVMVDVSPARLLREVVLAPAVLLVAATAVLAVLMNRGRLGLELAGGRLLPPEGLGATWASYLAEWHPVGGGSAAPAPTALAVLGVLGAPVGSPRVVVSLLLLAALPLAALSAYLATRSVPVTRAARALVAAGYALLPVGTAAVAQGRLDVVVAHVALPLVLAGTVAVLRSRGDGRSGDGLRGDGRSGAWLPTVGATALGLAVIGAFVPALLLLVLAAAVIGFVLMPANRATLGKRTAGLFALALLPLGLLLPWPAVVVQRPEVLIHGTGAAVPEQWPGWTALLALDPGGPGAAPWVGVVLVVAALLAALLRPQRAMLPGLGVVLLGAGAAAALGSVAVQPLAGGTARPGFVGAPLLLAACGLLWMVLVACRSKPAVPRPAVSGLRRALPVAAGVAVATLAAGAVLTGAAGPLGSASRQPAAPALAPALATELARDGTSVLVVGDEGDPVRLTRGRTPRFGDDSIAPLQSTLVQLDRVGDVLVGRQPGQVDAVLADVAALGVEFVVLPQPESTQPASTQPEPTQPGPAQRALATAGALSRSAPPTAEGRPVLRLIRPNPGAELLGPQLSGQARTGASPPVGAAPTGVPVAAPPPTVAARVAPGADDRLLVLAANYEPGWRASVDGAPAPVLRAWGHQVAVEVPGPGAEVRVDRSQVTRTALLLGQAAVVLLVAVAALPSRRSRDTATPM